MEKMTDGKMPMRPVVLADSERQPCEVWTRVMGYHRPVASFNIGKKGEHYERCFFRERGRALTAAPTERRAHSLRIGGLTPLSATDWPGQLAAVVFCQGCPWRCGYCHNPHLLTARGTAEIDWNDILAFLGRRRGLLDGVVFSGGEPLAQRGLSDAMRAVRSMGFRVALHTGGAYPRRLAHVLPLVDWVGFDVKAPFAAYASITGVPASGMQALRSARLLIASGVAHEFRTTVHPRQLAPAAIERLTAELAQLGARHYALQRFRAEGCADTALVQDLSPSFLTESYAAALAPRFFTLELRPAGTAAT